MLDFVPNHTALDHPWVEDHPEYLRRRHGARPGSRAAELHAGSDATAATCVLAHGRDPYFPGWPDTLQLDYGNPATQEAMIGELLKIAGQCDGVRCDMAMLVLPDVFERTWGIARRAVLAGGDAARARAVPGLLLHGRGLLGPRVDAAAAGLRLHLRQAALRPPARGPRPAGARAPARRARLPGQAGPLPGEPRRAARGRRLRPGRARGRGGRSRSCRPGCASSTRASSRAGRSGSRRTWSAAPDEPVDRGWTSSTTACSACSAGRPCATASGELLDASPAWDGNGPRTASSPSPGAARATSACWSR